MNQQASRIDAVEVPVVNNSGDDHDGTSDEEVHVPVQPAKFEFITPPANSKPSNSFRRRVIV